MITIIDNLPAHVIGVRASDEVTASDVSDVLLPALQKKIDEVGEINYLLVLETDVQNWTAGAWLQDMKAGLLHFTKWNRIAVVTDQAAVEKFTDLFTHVVPGKAKGFDHSEIEEARAWVASS